MYKSFTKTVDASEELVVECGFVPSAIRILNITNGVQLLWSDKMPLEVSDGKEQYAIIGANGALDATGDDVGYVSNADGALTLIDGSDKTNNVTSSFGFKLASNTVHINDEDAEVLIIEVFREDGV